MSIRVLIADDHTLLRSGLRALLERAPDISVVGEAPDGREALRLIEELRPDVVLMDVTMAGLNGLEATMRAARDHRGVRVVILSMHKHEEYVVHAVQAGASGYLLKDVATTELETAIRTVMKGHRYLSAEAAQRVADYEERFGTVTSRGGLPGSPGSVPGRDPTQLTQREREVLQLIAEGRTMQEIATVLAISPKTVETHRYRLMDRLNIHHVAGLVRYAMRVGLVQPE
ncbi:MAG TPA: response regulator transcription factor [Chloroflexota bacterium]|nr:response regulator transcription factor [Chloroflexota bacterium]